MADELDPFRQDIVRRMNRQIERKSAREALGQSEFVQQIRATIEGPLATMPCGELLERMLDLTDVARSIPFEGHVSSGVKSEYRRKAKRLHFNAVKADCLTDDNRIRLDLMADTIADNLGERDNFDRIEDYERAVRQAMGGRAGMAPGP